MNQPDPEDIFQEKPGPSTTLCANLPGSHGGRQFCWLFTNIFIHFVLVWGGDFVSCLRRIVLIQWLEMRILKALARPIE